MKATGVSLYRIVTPVLCCRAVLAVALFAFDESYLPAPTGGRRRCVRDKGKPAQTFLRPDRKWMSGQASGIRRAYAHLLLPVLRLDRDVFANLTVFEFEPGTFTLSAAHLRRERALGRGRRPLGV